MADETLSTLVQTSDQLGSELPGVMKLSGSCILTADLERAKSRYLVSGREDGGITIHDLHSTTQQTYGPVTRTVFPCVHHIEKSRRGAHKRPVDQVKWYPGDYGHFSSSSIYEETLKIWDPNNGQVMGEFSFDGASVKDHCYSTHQPLIAVALSREIRLIDLRTGYTGQKLERPKAGLDRVQKCCRQIVQPSISRIDPSGSGKHSKRPTSSRHRKNHHSYLHLPQGSSDMPVNSSVSSRDSGTSSRSRPNSNSRDSSNSSFFYSRCYPPSSSQASAYNKHIMRKFQEEVTSSVCFHPAMPSVLTTGYADGATVMWDVRSSRSYLFNLMDHFDAAHRPLSPNVLGLRYSSDGQHLVSFTRDSVLLWDGYTGESLANKAVFHLGICFDFLLNRGVGDVKISPASKCVFVCVGKDMIAFDLLSGTEISRFSGHVQPIEGIVIDHSQHRLFTYGQDANFITWCFNTKEQILNSRNEVSNPIGRRHMRRPGPNIDWSSDEESDDASNGIGPNAS
ncbi:WD40-repeat-containing domain [Trinorchestia longiramus]|nr:WD40-repeat-containing domain [Trinorchestia longiramus]